MTCITDGRTTNELIDSHNFNSNAIRRRLTNTVCPTKLQYNTNFDRNKINIGHQYHVRCVNFNIYLNDTVFMGEKLNNFIKKCIIILVRDFLCRDLKPICQSNYLVSFNPFRHFMKIYNIRPCLRRLTPSRNFFRKLTFNTWFAQSFPYAVCNKKYINLIANH